VADIADGGNLNLTYSYDARGQLISLTDWDNRTSTMTYDGVGRHTSTNRQNGLQTGYGYTARGHLNHIHHSYQSRIVAQFAYETDRRGNRIKAQETTGQPAVSYAFNDAAIAYRGNWSDSAPFKTSLGFTDSLGVAFNGMSLSFTYGTGADHSIFDVYVDGSLWQSFDGYSLSPGEQTVNLTLTQAGAHLFEIRNRAEKRSASSGYRMHFRGLTMQPSTIQTILYSYDRLSRVRDVDYYAGTTSSGSPFRSYDCAFDRAGNRTQQVVTIERSLLST
jgi:YD repeat-containing protein